MDAFFNISLVLLSLILCAWVSAELAIKYYMHQLRKEIERKVKLESKAYEIGFNDAKDIICDDVSLVLAKKVVDDLQESQYKNGMKAAISIYERCGEWE